MTTENKELLILENEEIHTNPVGITGKETVHGENGSTDAPQAAAASAAAERAEGEAGAGAPPAAVTATAEESFTAEPTGAQTLYTEEQVTRLVEESVRRLAGGASAERELEYLRLKQDLASERRLRRTSENKLACIRALEAADVPVAFAELLTAEDAEEMEARISVFLSTVRAWINREVAGKLETLTPRVGNGDTGITKAQFRAMRIAEQQEIYMNNRPLYEELSR